MWVTDSISQSYWATSLPLPVPPTRCPHLCLPAQHRWGCTDTLGRPCHRDTAEPELPQASRDGTGTGTSCPGVPTLQGLHCGPAELVAAEWPSLWNLPKQNNAWAGGCEVPWNHRITESQNHRIANLLSWKGPTKIIGDAQGTSLSLSTTSIFLSLQVPALPWTASQLH